MKNEFSRRAFLQTGAVAAGGLLAAKTILLDPVVASASPQTVAPSDRVPVRRPDAACGQTRP